MTAAEYRPPARVGVVGLGNMGGPVAENLLRAGYEVVAYDRDEERTAAIVSHGAVAAPSLADLARGSDVILLWLPGPPEIEGVTFGDEGLMRHISPGTTLVSMSTVSPELVQRIAHAAQEVGADFIDAPVTGAADGARSGSLIVMIGGDEPAVRRMQPVFSAIASTTHYLGPVGSGSVAKLLTNMLWFTHVVALTDALALGAKAGIDPAVLGEVVRVGAGGSWVAEHDLPNILRGNDDESFTLALCSKDLSLISRLVDELAVEATLLQRVRDRFEAAHERYGGSAGELAVARIVEEAAGVSVRAE